MPESNTTSSRGLPGLDSMAIGFHWGDQGPFVGDMQALERLAVAVRFPAASTPLLPLTEKVLLTFCGAGIATAKADGRLIYSAREGDTLLYDFRIKRATEEALERILSIRQLFRVPPHSENPVRMRVVGKRFGKPAEALVKDLSEGGAALLVSGDDDALLYDSEVLKLELDLPDMERIHLRGRVRYRMLSGASIRYGVQFETAGISGSMEDQLRIARYVLLRQQEMIRSSNEARDRA